MNCEGLYSGTRLMRTLLSAVMIIVLTCAFNPAGAETPPLIIEDTVASNFTAIKIGKLKEDSGKTNVALDVQDNNHWIWKASGVPWGIFWAGDGTNVAAAAEYQTEVDTENPNEVVFVGNGVARAAIDLDRGDAYFRKVYVKHGIYIGVEKWSDFVFDDEYDLPTLDEVEVYIREHGHLPGIPAEEELRATGLSVTDMHARMLQKIEELTLYAIAQNRRIEELEQQLAGF